MTAHHPGAPQSGPTAATVAHTPGKWVAVDFAIEADSPKRDGFTDVIAWVSSDVEEATARANARLIAAAPKLLAALKQAYEFTPAHGADCEGTLVFEEGGIFEDVIGCTCFLSEWKAAIFKAEGRSE